MNERPYTKMSQRSGAKKHWVPNNRHSNRLMPDGVSKAVKNSLGKREHRNIPRPVLPPQDLGIPNKEFSNERWACSAPNGGLQEAQQSLTEGFALRENRQSGLLHKLMP